MTKYLFKRLLHGLVSVVIVVGCVMTMIYSLMDRNLIFAQDATYSHQSNNQKKVYKYQKWETYGYLDYVTYADYRLWPDVKGMRLYLGRQPENRCRYDDPR